MSNLLSDPAGAAHIKLLTHEVMVYPYDTYALLRENDPVHWDDRLNGWILTRYDDVCAGLRDHETYSSQRLGALVSSRVGTTVSEEMATFVRLASEWMWMLDPPQHTRVRALMSQGFSPRDIRRLQPLVEEVVSGLIDDMLEQQEFDLISGFAYLVPALVLVDLFGLPRADARMLTDWCDAIKVFLGGSPAIGATGGPAAEALRDMIDYLYQVIRDRKQNPKDDLVTRIVMAREETDRLSEEELCSNLLLLLAAGFETTVDTIGNGLNGLLTQRDQWELVKSDPATIPAAIDEILRYDGSVQLTHRFVTRDLQLEGKRIERGQLAYLVRGSANRDPARFADPDKLDITRREGGHVGLGLGVHYCLGAGLARLEQAVALTALTRRMPDLRLIPDAPPRWRADSLQFRGLATLPATVGESE